MIIDYSSSSMSAEKIFGTANESYQNGHLLALTGVTQKITAMDEAKRRHFREIRRMRLLCPQWQKCLPFIHRKDKGALKQVNQRAQASPRYTNELFSKICLLISCLNLQCIFLPTEAEL